MYINTCFLFRSLRYKYGAEKIFSMVALIKVVLYVSPRKFEEFRMKVLVSF
jgi:hypothetical protein